MHAGHGEKQVPHRAFSPIRSDIPLLEECAFLELYFAARCG